MEYRTTEAYGEKVTAKKKAEKSSNADENKVDKKKRAGKTMHCCNR